MSFERASAYLEEKGFADRIIITKSSSATVAEAAVALGCEKGMIAKTLSFLQGDKPVLILAEGLARIDNAKYKARFSCKAKLIPQELVEKLVGHCIGGVCPFGINENVSVYLDESLKRHDTVYPAAGTDHSAVRLSIAELNQVCPDAEWGLYSQNRNSFCGFMPRKTLDIGSPCGRLFAGQNRNPLTV